ncbi:hypothetical protein GOP47_0014312 [Adiantum capillus-veneris]|uniref:Uncharacterized protein n=1 Tax=Adiantum capillus-veneris TaxID=13818 RepID=A0A9D4ZCC2_ADICA|nr:hypothetical protein GOP47_0014312 [Adiantum capillus-veneris]
MPTAFEVVFLGMLDDAQCLGLDLPYDTPTVAALRKECQRKLNRYICSQHCFFHHITRSSN